MKGLAVGDIFVPTSKMIEVFSTEGVKDKITEVVTTEFKSKSRDDIRRKIRNIEAHGTEAEAPPKDLEPLIRDVDILVIHLCPVSWKMLERAQHLKILGIIRGGVDNIDIKTATERGIAVINTPDHNAQAVAEYTIGLMIAETRNIARSHFALKNGEWRENYLNTEFIPELNGSTVGLVGFGHNGKLVAGTLSSFNVNILVHDPYVSNEIIEESGCHPVDFETLLKESDIVSIHVKLTPETQKMIGENELKMMKSTSYIINTSRAALFELKALTQALKEKWIMGAAVDVYEIEPAPSDYPLFSLDNVTLTSHRAGDTRNAYWKAPLLMGKQIAKLLRGEIPDFIVNPVVLRK